MLENTRRQTQVGCSCCVPLFFCHIFKHFIPVIMLDQQRWTSTLHLCFVNSKFSHRKLGKHEIKLSKCYFRCTRMKQKGLFNWNSKSKQLLWTFTPIKVLQRVSFYSWACKVKIKLHFEKLPSAGGTQCGLKSSYEKASLAHTSLSYSLLLFSQKIAQKSISKKNRPLGSNVLMALVYVAFL